MTAVAPTLQVRRPDAHAAISTRPQHPLVRFAGVGSVATALQLGLFALLQLAVPVLGANILAWAASTATANTVNRSVTFGVHGRTGARRDFWVSTGFSMLGLAISVVALAQLTSAGPVSSVLILVSVNLLVGLLRFYALRRWFAVRTA